MAYPRGCEGCGASFNGWSGQLNFPHLTLAAEDGGASSPWAPDQPGRIMDIGCRLCGSIFRWDYFAVSAEEPRLGRAIGIVRGPVAEWTAQDNFGVLPRAGRAPALRKAS